jgi:hypothetical protein
MPYLPLVPHSEFSPSAIIGATPLCQRADARVRNAGFRHDGPLPISARDV